MTVSNSKLEINIKRLLKHCELLGRESKGQYDWRLEKYVEALGDMLTDLQKRPKKPPSEVLSEYIRRIEFLKKLVESKKIDNPVERVVAVQMMSHGVHTPDGNITREIHQKTTSRYNADIRNQLFGLDNATADELRLRKNEKSSGEDLDSLIKYHNNMREKIAEDMLLMTRSLKEQSQLAGDIIRKDIETVQKSTSLADQNLSKLKIESERLQEHSRRAWKCWMWVLIVIVMVVFINMVLFMKVMKKRV